MGILEGNMVLNKQQAVAGTLFPHCKHWVFNEAGREKHGVLGEWDSPQSKGSRNEWALGIQRRAGTSELSAFKGEQERMGS